MGTVPYDVNYLDTCTQIAFCCAVCVPTHQWFLVLDDFWQAFEVTVFLSAAGLINCLTAWISSVCKLLPGFLSCCSGIAIAEFLHKMDMSICFICECYVHVWFIPYHYLEGSLVQHNCTKQRHEAGTLVTELQVLYLLHFFYLERSYGVDSSSANFMQFHHLQAVTCGL